MFKRLKYLILFLILVFTDQLIKYYLFTQKRLYSLNSGISFNIKFPFLLFFILLSLGILCYYFFRTKNKKKKIFLLLIISGGFSNLLDRYFYLGVVDYINFINLFKNNLADIYISLGILGLVLY